VVYHTHTYNITTIKSSHILPPYLINTTPFPYTTLFRSNDFTMDLRGVPEIRRTVHRRKTNSFYPKVTLAYTGQDTMTGGRLKRRSEEHTSELQSLAYLVCRLLLEKKKIIDIKLF